MFPQPQQQQQPQQTQGNGQAAPINPQNGGQPSPADLPRMIRQLALQNLTPQEIQVLNQSLTPQFIQIMAKLYGPQEMMKLAPLMNLGQHPSDQQMMQGGVQSAPQNGSLMQNFNAPSQQQQEPVPQMMGNLGEGSGGNANQSVVNSLRQAPTPVRFGNKGA
jgi:hypothetical protein